MPDCLNCIHWQRSDDPVVGWCLAVKGWRFQFEDCPGYEAGENREPGEPAELPEPEKYPDNDWTRPQILANQERIRRWHKEGRPYRWMAQMCRIPYWGYQSISKWLAREENRCS